MNGGEGGGKCCKISHRRVTSSYLRKAVFSFDWNVSTFLQLAEA